MINIKGKLEFGNKEQIRMIKEEQQREEYSFWAIKIIDNYGYVTEVQTELVYENEEQAIEYAKQFASTWSTLFEGFKYEATRIPLKNNDKFDKEDFESDMDYLRYMGIILSKNEEK